MGSRREREDNNRHGYSFCRERRVSSPFIRRLDDGQLDDTVLSVDYLLIRFADRIANDRSRRELVLVTL